MALKSGGLTVVVVMANAVENGNGLCFQEDNGYKLWRRRCECAGERFGEGEVAKVIDIIQ